MSEPAHPVALHARSVSKSYGAARALSGVDVAVARGQTVALIGPSGSGKTTLLRTCNGLVWPDEGDVWVSGARLERGARLRAQRHRIGMVIQEGGLFPHLTARQNIELLARTLGWEEARRRARVEDLRRLAQLPPETLERHPHELSGGQRQRVALLRALMLEPEVLLLDEPLGALDPLVRRELQDDLARLFRELGTAVLLVTHDFAEAAFLADHVVLMRDGRVVQAGTPDELVNRPAEDFVARFLEAQRPPPGLGARSARV